MSNQPNNAARGVGIITIQDLPDQNWAQRGACVGHDPDLFFRDEHDSTSYREARAICGDCPVRCQCLTWALDTRTQFGVFGGLTPRQRRQYTRNTADV